MNKKKIFSVIVVNLVLAFAVYFIYNWMAPKSLQLSEEQVTKTLEENESYFSKIVDYALVTEGNLNLYYDKGAVALKNISLNTTIVKDKEVISMADYIVKQLNFEAIAEGDRSVFFFAETVGGLEHGIVYSESKDLSFFRETRNIKGNWYYYWTTHE